MTQAAVGQCVSSIGDDCFKNCTSLSSLTIPNTVTSIGSAACNSCSALTSVSIPNSVTYIGGYAFQRCSGLTSIALPSNLSSLGAYAFTLCRSISSVTMNSLLVLDNYTFSSCGNLKRINSNVDGVYNIPNGVASINNSCFRDCSGLTDLYLPNSLETIGDNAFMNCTNLSGLTIPTGVTSIGNNAFFSATSLVNVGIPHSVTSIGTYAFMNCRRITSVIIGSGITSIGNYAFQNCSNLVSLTVNAVTPPTLGSTALYNTNPNLKIYVPCESLNAYKTASGWSDYESLIEPITQCEAKFHAYYNGGTDLEVMCNSSSTISVSETNIQGYNISSMSGCTIGNCVDTIGTMAFQDSGLISIDIPSGVTSIENYAFRGSTGLTTVTVNATTPTTLGSDVFVDVSSSLVIEVPCSSVNTYKSASGWSSYSSKIQGISPCGTKFVAKYNGGAEYEAMCDSSSAITSTDTNPQGYSIYSMSSCTIGSCVTSIGAEAFQDSGLKSIVIPTGVTSIGNYAFRGSTGLTTVTSYPWTPPSLGSDVFVGVGSNLNIYVPCTSVTAYQTAWPEYASNILGIPPCQPVVQTKFKASYSVGADYEIPCSNITTLTANDVDGSTNPLSAMTSCIIGGCVTSIGFLAFDGASSLSSVTIPNSVTYIDAGAFNECSGLTSITIPSGVTAINDNTFNYCKNLKRLNSNVNGECLIPSGTTSIGHGAFEECTSLSSVTMPNSVTSIGQRAFYHCNGLTAITLSNSITSIPNYMLYLCAYITNIAIPSGVTEIGEHSFRQCYRLQSVTIPSGVTSIGQWAFNNCSQLTSFTCLAPTPPTLGNMALGTTNGCPIYVPSGSVSAYQSASGWSTYASRITAIT